MTTDDAEKHADRKESNNMFVRACVRACAAQQQFVAVGLIFHVFYFEMI